jgi:cob(I)alamin adenosyltransferase
MWYGSSVFRHGKSRPCRRYQASKRERNRRRSGGAGRGSGFGLARGAVRFAGISYNSASVKLYTRTGDSGETALFGGTRVKKDDPRVDAYGEVDELNAWLGLVRAAGLDPDLDTEIVQIQRDLFALAAQLADPADKIANRVTKAALEDEDVVRLEHLIDRLETEVPPLRRFILPGGSTAGAVLHVARTVCRRAERRIVSLAPPVDPVLLRFVNRLSDLLFVLARAVNVRAGAPETEW